MHIIPANHGFWHVCRAENDTEWAEAYPVIGYLQQGQTAIPMILVNFIAIRADAHQQLTREVLEKIALKPVFEIIFSDTEPKVSSLDDLGD